LFERLEDRTLLSAVMGSMDLVSTWPNGMPFQVSGWAFDADVATNGSGPVTVRLDIDGFPATQQQATESRPDIVHVVGTANHGYTFTVNPLAPGTHTLRVVAIDQPFGEERTLGVKTLNVRAGSLGVVESFDLTNGISGWALDPVLPTGSVQIQVNVDGRIAATTTANQQRPDLQPFFGSTAHGYSLPVPALTPGIHQVSVFALSLLGTPTLLGTFSATPPGPPVGHLDVANAGIIGGWAVDANDTTVGVPVRIDIDGVTVRTLTTNIVRPDLATFGTGPFGFQINTPLLGVGPHTVQMFAIDNPSGVPVLIGSQSLTIVPRSPIGSVDMITATAAATQVVGWTIDPDTPAQPVAFRIDVDKLPVVTGTATLNRPDLALVYGTANHGFSATLGPLSLGTHIIDVYALDTTTGALKLLKSTAIPVTA